MLKKLVKCRNCYEKEKVVRTLCEVKTPGLVIIRRMNTKESKENTIVRGTNFEIICGFCGEVVFFTQK